MSPRGGWGLDGQPWLVSIQVHSNINQKCKQRVWCNYVQCFLSGGLLWKDVLMYCSNQYYIMRNDDENKNMIPATVEDGILHIHTAQKAGFIMENAKANGTKDISVNRIKTTSKWLYRSWSFGGFNWTMTLLKCIPFTELRSSDLVRRRRGEFAALSVWTFHYHPEQTVSWLYIWWSNNTSASLPEAWQHNPADFEDIQGGERTGLCLRAEIKNAAISNASSDNDIKKKRKTETLTFYFHHRKRATRNHTMAQQALCTVWTPRATVWGDTDIFWQMKRYKNTDWSLPVWQLSLHMKQHICLKG